MKTRSSVPASLFGIPVGVLGLAGAWNVGARIWQLPPVVGSALGVIGTLIWLVLLILYVQEWLCSRATAQAEAHDPLRSSFVALVFISMMLVSMTILQVSRSAAIAFFGIAVVAQLALGLWLLGRTWQGGSGADFATPALYLPGVGQNFVAASCATLFGWQQIGMWLFGCGAFAWLAIESIVLGRAATRDPLPPAARTALGIQLAPPVVGGLAYLSLTTGAPDMVAHLLFGYGLYQAALLLRLSAWIRQPLFTASYWSFSFGATALPTMAMRMVERGDAGPMAWVAPVLFACANLFILYLGMSTLQLVVQRKLFPNEVSAAKVPDEVRQ